MLVADLHANFFAFPFGAGIHLLFGVYSWPGKLKSQPHSEFEGK